MSKPRRGKSASTNEISRWEQELNQAPFNEEAWTSCVFFVAPNNVDDNVFIDVMADVVATGLRKLFSVITYEGLIKDVKEFGKGQAVGGGKGKGAAAATHRLPPFHEVCEQAKPLVDQGDSLPLPLMAKLLKFKLLHIKQKDLDRREEERKGAKLAESGKKDEKGKKSRSPSGKRSKSPGKKKGKKGEADMPPSPKKDSKLKKRGDIDDTFKTIDDEPDDEGCPQHYVLIHGILMAPVINHLSEIGISVDAIICIQAESYERFGVKAVVAEVDPVDEQEDGDVLEMSIKEEEMEARRKEADNELHNFWSESESVVLKAPSGHKLKDMARYEVVVKDKNVPEENLSELEGEKRTEFGTVIFDDVAVTCYNMQDHFLQYKQYLESIKLLNVPVHIVAKSASSGTQSITDIPSTQSVVTATQGQGDPASMPVEVDTRYYSHLMDAVPTASHSVPIILHCLLEQVSATINENSPLDQEVAPRQDGLNHVLASYITSKAHKLAMLDDEKESIIEHLANQKKGKTTDMPIMLHHGDQLMSRTHHLNPVNGLDPIQAELNMLQFLPQNILKDLPQPKGREIVERAARANELRRFCTSEVDPVILEQALKQYAFEGVLLKIATEDGDIIDPIHLDDAFKSYSNPWDDPYPRLEEFRKVKFCSDESGKLKISAVESASESPLTSFRNMDDWCFVEHLNQNTLLQVLEEARFWLPYLDTYYHKRDHSLLLALHNPVGPQSRSTSSWETKLHSNVGFRNYLEHVVSSIDAWIEEQERVKKEAARTPTPPPPVIEQPSIPLKVGSRYGLMTRAEVNAIKAEEEEKNKKGKGKKSARGSRSPKRSAKSKDKAELPDKKDTDKKREGSASSRPKSGRSPSAKGSFSVKSATSKVDKRSRTRSRMSAPEDPEPEVQTEELTVQEHHDFIGYDVGDNLIHASGSLSTLFPCDGGQIRVDKTSFVQGAQNVRVSVYKDGNIFVLHFLEPIDEMLKAEDIEGKEKEGNEDPSDQQRQDGEGGKEEGIEKSELEGTEKEPKEEPPKAKPKGPKPFSDFSSFVAQFSDGMILTHSGYGPSGSLIDKEPRETDCHLIAGPAAADVSVPVQGTPSPQPKAGSPKARKKVDEEAKRIEELQIQQEEERLRLEEEVMIRAEEEKKRKPFQNLYITCPDGLHLEYFNDGNYDSYGSKGGVAVRQKYPVRGCGKQECEEARQKPAMEEQSRTILTNGTIIKLMKEGGIQVLFPDGSISKCPSYPTKTRAPSSKPTSAVGTKPQDPPPAKKNARPSASQKSVEEPAVPTISLPEKIPEWVSTGLDGTKITTQPDGEVEPVEGVLCSVATCPASGEVLRTREDNVVTVEQPDGTLTVEHADGSRVTTYYKQLQCQTQVPDNETGEQAQYSTISGKFVKVECSGFATLVFNYDEGSCETVFGNGVKMSTMADGVTVMDRLDGSRLHVDVKGIVSYVPRKIAGQVDLLPRTSAVESPDMPAGVYVMRTNQQVCCEVMDGRGTRFSVVANGKMSIEKSETQDSSKLDTENVSFAEEGTKEQDHLPATITVAPVTSLVPRYFIIHADGSGSELLRYCDVEDVLSQAEKDPATALVKAPVEGHPGVTGITIMRPYSGDIGKVWLRQKDQETVIPRGLRERDFRSLPAREEKRPGPQFGTNVGAGVNVGTVTKCDPGPPLITCPQALEFRQLIQHKQLTAIQRQQIVKAMEAYSEYVSRRQEGLDSILPQDPRDESEKLAAEQLELKMEEGNEEDEYNIQGNAAPDTIDSPSDDITQVKDNIRETAGHLSDQIKGPSVSKQYVDAITLDPVPPPSPPKWKRPETEWERDRIELAELEYGKHALKYKEVPNYFETAQGQAFLRQTYSNDMPDMETLTSALAQQARHPPPGEMNTPDTPQSDVAEEGKDKTSQDYSSPEIPQVGNSSPSINVNGEMTSPLAGVSSLSPNNLRPTNPTPAHAKGGGTPTPLRPTNPTPSHASSKPSNPRPSNPTPKHAMEEAVGSNTSNTKDSPSFGESPQWRNNLESVQEVEVAVAEQVDGVAVVEAQSVEDDDAVIDTPDDPKFGPRSLYIDVTGEVRKDKVTLPLSILSSKPGALPNTQFMEVEDPVRRRVHTVSVAGGNKISQGRVENLRGFELLPPSVSFGVLKEGCTYISSVLLKNVGIDSCRYKVKQPPPSTGLRILYNPGPVAAGMSAKLDVEIFAVAVGVVGENGVGHVGHHVEIVTETDVLYLAAYATIMTSFEYENRYGVSDSGLSNGTMRVPNRPPSRDPTRPRKAEDYALISTEAN